MNKSVAADGTSGYEFPRLVSDKRRTMHSTHARDVVVRLCDGPAVRGVEIPGIAGIGMVMLNAEGLPVGIRLFVMEGVES